ncbi:MAG TPA: calcium/sodium antiporter [Alphaproteobacteria bacterium]|nr:calcium/sodium antiporter [Alphaproteobacteria bacterium]USO05348.1 MAG: calcium/sodium antiporter [Rhodospirillales bacterium]HOO81228.1 calcium/sodium antiporter [Alphaproteobacteria bacterium]
MDVVTLQALVIPLGLIMFGTALLIKGGNWTIDSAVFIARRFGLSPMVVGFTILAFGTSLPELIVSILAVLRGSEGIAMGNVIGSNIANILLVIGCSSVLVTMQITLSKGLIKDLVMMLLSAFLLMGLMLYGEIGRIAGLGMVAILLMYIFVQYRMAMKGEIVVDGEDLPFFKHPAQPYVFLVLGLCGVGVGAEFLVRGASQSAAILGVPEDVVALSIIAFGTSLPELSTSIIGARRGHAEMALGNIVGSNVFNILIIIGITALVKPIAQGSYADQLLEFDIWFMLAVTVVFAALVAGYRKITPVIGGIFVSAYVVYTIYIYAINFGT